jgi:DNA-binding PadR family transcriptional regulator
MAQSDLPLAPAAFLILFALAGGDKHGYAIMQEARKLSDGGFQIGPATLYTTIQRLLESGWIREAPSPEDSDSRRRYYGLTAAGSSILELDLERMETLVRKSKKMRLRSAESAS